MRAEDRAHCLLGIFGVNMPMLYGEREKAFYRLQEEIIKQLDNHSIFAWPMRHKEQPGLLPESPDAFAQCMGVRSMTSREGRSPYAVTNRGLSIRLLATPFSTNTYLVRLECADSNLPHGDDLQKVRLGMLLRRLDEDDQLARVRLGEQTFTQVNAAVWSLSITRRSRSTNRTQEIQTNVRKTNSRHNRQDRLDRVNGFRITRPFFSKSSSADLLRNDPPKMIAVDFPAHRSFYNLSGSIWDPVERIVSVPSGQPGWVGYLDLTPLMCRVKLVKLGFDFDYNPVCFIAMSEELKIVPGSRTESSKETAEHLEHVVKHGQPENIASLIRDPLDSTTIAKGRAWPFGKHRGLGAARGDRIDGLDCRPGDVGRLQIKRVDIGGGLVWDVWLEQ